MEGHRILLFSSSVALTRAKAVSVSSPSFPEMGIIRSSFSFMTGTLCGIYVAQNYDVPNVKKLAYTALFMAKVYEEKYRKPDKPREVDD